MPLSRTRAPRLTAGSNRPVSPGALLLAAAIALHGACAFAAPVVYTGYDNHVSTLSLNAVIAAETFYDAASPHPSIIDFESALPAGVGITGDDEQIVDTDTCGTQCGYNTSPVGSHFLQLAGTGANVTFTFATPVTAFGFYLTGLQSGVMEERMTFDDGTAQVIPIAPTTNGDAFIGFIDPAGVTSVTYEASLDVVGIDDVWYGSPPSSVPEPATFAMFGVGLIGIGLARRRCA